MSLRRTFTMFACVAVACVSTPEARDREVDLGPRTESSRMSFHERGGRFVSMDGRQAVSIGDSGITFVTKGMHRTRLALETTSSPRASAARLDRDGSVSIARADGSTEHLRMSARGLEQSWVYATHPSTRGDLVVRVHATTQARAEDTETGVRFVDEAADRSVVYDDIAWVDADGLRTPLVARLDGEDVVMRVPASVVDSSSYPATLDPTVSAATSVGTPIVAEAPGNYSGLYDVVPGKDGGFLVIMADYRVLGFVTDMVTYRPGEVWGARIAADGSVLDPTGFPIKSITDEEVYDAAGAWDGTQWLVLLEQGGDFTSCSRYAATRVSAAGVVLDPSFIDLSCSDSSTRAGFDGQDFFLLGAIRGTNPSITLNASYISKTGVLKNAAPFDVVNDQRTFFPGLACDGSTTCLVSYKDASNNVLTRRVGKGGVIDATPRTMGPGNPAWNAYDGTNFVVAWTDATGTWVRRVSPATGDVVDSPLKITSDTTTRGAATNGTTLVAWISSGQLNAVRYAAGALVDAAPLALTTAASGTTGTQVVAGNGAQFFTAWHDLRSISNGTVYGARFTTAGQTPDGNGIQLRKSANGQRDPAIAGDGTNGWLAAWEDTRAGEIHATRLDANGQPLEPSGIVLATGFSPHLASSGTGWLATWRDEVDVSIHARLVSSAGVLATPFTLAPGDLSSATFDGTNYVVAHGTQYNGTPGVSRISTAGAVLGTTAFPGGEELAIASSGTESLVIWIGFGDIRGRRIAKDGSLPDAADIVLAPETNWPLRGIALAWDGTNYVAAWMDLRDSPEAERKASVRYTRISKAGVRLDALGGRLLNARSTNQQFPAVIGMADGQNALIAWSDNRRTDRKDEFDLFGAMVRTTDGEVLDPDGFTISNGIGNEFRPAFAPRSASSVIAAYYHVDPSAGLGAERVRTRFIGSGALVAAKCTTDADCSSRACTDGICCESSCRGSCQSCDASGKCLPVANADDQDSCTGDKTCDANAKCLVKPGRTCAKAEECTSGICSTGVCCDRACDGACETCTVNPGKCEPRAARSGGAPSCEPFACDGKSNACPKTCTDDSACPSGSRCDVATKSCISGAVCLDDQTIGGVGEPASCAPYRCESTACRTTCRGVQDCVYPAVCDEGGHCSPPSGLQVPDVGCTTSPRSIGSRGSDTPWSVTIAVALAVLALRARSGTRARGRRARTSLP